MTMGNILLHLEGILIDVEVDISNDSRRLNEEESFDYNHILVCQNNLRL